MISFFPILLYVQHLELCEVLHAGHFIPQGVRLLIQQY